MHPLPTAKCARRLIDLRLDDDETAVGWLEDHFHHFGVTIKHRGGVVTDVRMAWPRHPWVTCPGAAAPLRDLIGKPLVERASDIGRLVEMRRQCTHAFDLAGLTLAQAALGRERLRYEAIVTDRSVYPQPGSHGPWRGHGLAFLLANGERVLEWEIEHDHIIAPPRHAGRGLSEGFRAWTESMPLAAAEHAFIMRRAIMVAGSKAVDHDRFASAGSMNLPALCYSYQPGVREVAWREVGSTINYEANSAPMLALAHRTP